MLIKYMGVEDDLQATWAGAFDPRDYLKEGHSYEVARVDEHSWHTEIYLKDFPGVWFNSVCFDYHYAGEE